MTLTTTDTYPTPRGAAYLFDGVPGLDPRTLLGQTMTVNGRQWRVAGVDVFAVIDPTGMAFGLVLEEPWQVLGPCRLT